jgi:hypothetical protein
MRTSHGGECLVTSDSVTGEHEDLARVTKNLDLFASPTCRVPPDPSREVHRLIRARLMIASADDARITARTRAEALNRKQTVTARGRAHRQHRAVDKLPLVAGLERRCCIVSCSASTALASSV